MSELDYSFTGILISPCPNSISVRKCFFYVKILIDFMYIFLYLLPQILWKNRPEIKKILVWRSFFDAKIRTTFGGLSRLKVPREGERGTLSPRALTDKVFPKS